MWTPPINESAELSQGALWLIHYSEFEPRELAGQIGAETTEPSMLLDLATDVGNTEEENNGYVVFKWNIHGLAWKAGGGQG
jgi:hypothetical protein